MTLPLNLTFVDAEDRVAFFSEGPDRIFPRSKAIIGRKVRHCHPPRSADAVNKTLDDFRSGRARRFRGDIRDFGNYETLGTNQYIGIMG
jgi:DUF438 domain-containing protein